MCDDDGRRAALAADTVERMGYRDVSVLEGGINAWVNAELPTEWGMNVPSKDFGERIEIHDHVANISADDLHARLEEGRPTVILDSRTPEEYQRFAIPGGRSIPGGELPLRITDIAEGLEQDTAIIVNCAGRTRSIIGARVLQRMGIPNVYALTNGTAGWTLAGYELERGADRVDMPQPSDEASARGRGLRRPPRRGGRRPFSRHSRAAGPADRPLRAHGVPHRRAHAGRVSGRAHPRLSLGPRRAGRAAHRRRCRGEAQRRRLLLRRQGPRHGHGLVVPADGHRGRVRRRRRGARVGRRGTFVGRGRAGRSALRPRRGHGPPCHAVTPEELAAHDDAVVLFVDTSQEFASGHVPGARWIARGWLELRIGDLGVERDAPVVVTCADGRSSALAGLTLYGLGYTYVSYLEGGMAAWREAGLPVERGLTGVMAMPGDIPADTVIAGPERSYADTVTYLRWEIALGDKYKE